MSEIPHPSPFECFQSSSARILESRSLIDDPRQDQFTRFKLLKRHKQLLEEIDLCDCFAQYVFQSLEIVLTPPHPLVRAAKKGIRPIK